MKNNIGRLFRFFVLAFTAIVLALTNLAVLQRPQMVNSAYNSRRLAGWDSQSRRGGIYARDGEVLAQSVPGETKRRYQSSWAFAPVLGYFSPDLGASGLEARYAEALTGSPPFWAALGLNTSLFGQGEDLVLTVDKALQEQAMRLLAGRRGAVVVLDPKSGAVLALATQPSFDPAILERDWSKVSQDRAAPLLNRATQGLYPPGSTLKLVTLLAALTADQGTLERTYSCYGELKLPGYMVRCPEAHGELSLSRALAVSCNVTFATLGLELGNKAMAVQAEKAGFNSVPQFDLPVTASSFPRGDPGPGETAQRAIGQGQALTTPLTMAMLTAGLANGGVIMRPYLVSERRLAGRVVARTQPVQMSTLTTPEIAATVLPMLVEVTRKGTGRLAAISGLEVAGKTGSAENPHGPPHAWYVGFAPAEQPRVAVAVVVENSGSGGAVAAPIAANLIATALKEVR